MARMSLTSKWHGKPLSIKQYRQRKWNRMRSGGRKAARMDDV